ncbi:hypothetical protein T06_14314 [Trichinella sp. T6]|nr:hypothetical protein T06_14314 [Trichinella sp. T6]
MKKNNSCEQEQKKRTGRQANAKKLLTFNNPPLPVSADNCSYKKIEERFPSLLQIFVMADIPEYLLQLIVVVIRPLCMKTGRTN